MTHLRLNIDEPYVDLDQGIRITIKHDPDPMHPREDADCFGTFTAQPGNRYGLGDEGGMTALREQVESLVPEDADIDEPYIDCEECHAMGIIVDEDGDEDTCPECDGDGDVDNLHYVGDDLASLIEAIDRFDPEGKQTCLLPVYLYDHSGITLRTSPFSCGWDSGQIGVIWVSAEKCEGDFDKAPDILKGEIEALDQYVRGDVYGYVCEALMPVPPDWSREEWAEHDCHWKEINACWGFYGDDYLTNGIDGHLDVAYHQLVLADFGLSMPEFTEQQCAWIKENT